MADNIIIDTGPLFALFDSKEQYHPWANNQLATIKAPLITCEAVLSETLYLFQRNDIDCNDLFILIERGDLVVQPVFNTEFNQKRIRGIATKYADLPASFADACLVHMAEITNNARIFTLDSDFTVYRTASGQPLSQISPK